MADKRELLTCGSNRNAGYGRFYEKRFAIAIPFPAGPHFTKSLLSIFRREPPREELQYRVRRPA